MTHNYLLKAAVAAAQDGIVITDALTDDNLIIYANPAFERLTGYTSEEIIGKNCRFLQKEDRKQQEIHRTKNAIQNGDFCLVTLRNYRKDGGMFYNQLSISPVYNEDHKLTHFIGIQKDVTAETLLKQEFKKKLEQYKKDNEQLEFLSIIDPLTKLYNRRHFEHQAKVLFALATRLNTSISIFMIDVDFFKNYNDKYGHLEGDECLISISKVFKNLLTRASDFSARYGGEEFLILANDMTMKQTKLLAEKLCERVRSLSIPHSNQPNENKMVTISVGYTNATPNDQLNIINLLKRADAGLYKAKQRGKNQCALVNGDND